MEKIEDESPRNKVKFLCSYGGKVLPRPSDGVLKYVGGETRVICIPRDATFSDMMKKVSAVVDGEVVLKYQVIPEELDTLVSVRTEDDLKHMIAELDRHDTGGSPMLRTFLFPFKPLILDNQAAAPPPLPPVEPYLLEQRYLDAINGIIRPSPSSKFAAYSACSACSSPKSTSPDGHSAVESPFQHLGMQPLSKGMVTNTMQRVRSSPSLSSLTSTYNNTQPLQQPQQHLNHGIGISRSRSSHYQQQQHLLGGLRPIQEVGMGMGVGRLSPSQMNMNMNMMTDNMSSSSRGMNYYYSNANRPHKAYAYHDDSFGPHKAYAYHDDSFGPHKAYAYHDDSVGHVMVERVPSVPRSPRTYLGE